MAREVPLGQYEDGRQFCFFAVSIMVGYKEVGEEKCG